MDNVSDLRKEIAHRDEVIAGLKEEQYKHRSDKGALDNTTNQLRRELADANSRAENSYRELQNSKAKDLARLSARLEESRYEVGGPKKGNRGHYKQENINENERELRERVRHLELKLEATKLRFRDLVEKLSSSQSPGHTTTRKKDAVRPLGVQIKVRDDLDVDYRPRASAAKEEVAASTPTSPVPNVCHAARPSTSPSAPCASVAPSPTAGSSPAATREGNPPRPCPNPPYTEIPATVSDGGSSAFGYRDEEPLPLTASLCDSSHIHDAPGKLLPGPPIDDTIGKRQSATVFESRPKSPLKKKSNKGPPPSNALEQAHTSNAFNDEVKRKIGDSYKEKFSAWSSNIADRLLYWTAGSAPFDRHIISLSASGKGKSILDDQTWAGLEKQGEKILSFFPVGRSPDLVEKERKLMRELSGRILACTEEDNSHVSQKPCSGESHDMYSRLKVAARYFGQRSIIAQDEKRFSDFLYYMTLLTMESLDKAQFEKGVKDEFKDHQKSTQEIYQSLLSLLHSLSTDWQGFHLPLVIYLLRAGKRRLISYFRPYWRPAAIELLACRLNDPGFCAVRLNWVHNILGTSGLNGSSLLGILQDRLEVQPGDRDVYSSLKLSLGYVENCGVEDGHDGSLPEPQRELYRLKRKCEEGIPDKRLRMRIEQTCQEDPQVDSATRDWDSIRRRMDDSTSATYIATLLPGEELNDEAINKILRLFGWSPHVQLLDTFFLHLGYKEDWTPNASNLQVGTTVKQLVVPVLRDGHWTLLCVHIGDRMIDHYDSWLRNHPITDHQGCPTCQLMGQTVDKALEAAQIDKPKPPKWTFRTQDEQDQGSPLSPQQTNGKDCGVYLLFNAYCLGRGLKPCQDIVMPDDWRFKWALELLDQEANNVTSHAETPDTEPIDEESSPITNTRPLKRSTVDFKMLGAIPLSHSPEQMPQTINEEHLTLNGSHPPDNIKDAFDETTSLDSIFNSPSTLENKQPGSTGNLLPSVEGRQIDHDNGLAVNDTEFEVDKTATAISTQETQESTLEAADGTAAVSFLEAAGYLDSGFWDYSNELISPGGSPTGERFLPMEVDW